MPTINGTAVSSAIEVKVEWGIQWQNVELNKSAIYAIFYARRNDGYASWGTGTFNVTVNGNSSSQTKYVTLNQANGWVKLTEISVEVGHNNDGTKSVGISATGSIPGTVWSSTSLSATVELPTIPRASSVSLSKSVFDLGETITISINRASSSFTHSVRHNFGGTGVTIADNVDTSLTYTFPLTLANLIPNKTGSEADLWVDTYSGSTHIGTKYIKFTANVPSTVIPTVGAITVSDPTGHSAKTGGQYVQGYSKANVSVAASTGAYGSTIKSVTISAGSSSVVSSSGTFDLSTAGTVTITATAEDSRGRKHSRTANITVAAYSQPVISTFTAVRALSSGVVDGMGSYARVTTVGSATSIPNNTVSWVISYRLVGASSWTTATSGSDTAQPLAWNNVYTLGGGAIDPTKSYEFRVVASDKITSVSRSVIISAGLATMAWGKNSVGIGIIPTRGTLEVGGDVYATNALADDRFYEKGFTLDRLYGVGWPCYHFSNGYLIRTNIGPTEDVMFMLDIRLNTYMGATTVGTGELQVQGYSYGSGSAIAHTAATSTVGPRNVFAFFYSNTLHFWLSGGSYETAHINLRSQLGTGGANHRILNVTNVGMPASGVARSVTIVPEVLGYKPQTHATFTYSAGSTANGASRVLATGTITINKPSIVFFSGNFQALTDTNAAAWFDVEVVGVAGYQFRLHSYGKAIHTAAAWSRGFNVAAAGTYTVRVVARVDAVGGYMRFEDIHAEVWTF